jgi:hypothetical protein
LTPRISWNGISEKGSFGVVKGELATQAEAGSVE